jgi:hypothetical protein
MRDRLIYVAQRAYELARSGYYSDLASVEKAIIAEGFADGVAWLERPDVKDALQVICRNSLERRFPRGTDNQSIKGPACSSHRLKGRAGDANVDDSLGFFALRHCPSDLDHHRKG